MHPFAALSETFSSAANWNAFALFAVLMMGGFAVIPFISPYLVQNVGVAEEHLPLVYVVGGVLTLFVAPVVGRLADRYGKLLMFRIIAPLSALMLVVVTFLPPVHTAVAICIVGLLMVTNAGRMIAAMAMATGTVPAASRGGFMSANSSIQHIASGVGTMLGGKLIVESADGRLHHFGTVGLIACAITLLSIWLAGRLKPAEMPEAALLPVVDHG
jgi:predicted MFS family arabinose efflux permease